ncbi:hypothetical protein Tco_0990296 [Tanacetum coccineum]|uniref:DUF8039 domain-containing protein n=1 Tax=Tanacetum coccineum TaxID=301880 RepID=A0ABQ5EXP2_9ASTR
MKNPRLKETEDKIKEGTLKVDHGTDAMTFVLGKENGGYARGVESGVTYKRCECQQKDESVNKLSTEMTEKDVTPMGAYEVDETQSSVVVHDKDARIQKKSNRLVTSKKKSNTVAFGTVYKADGKQMLHNQELPNDCYKVSIDESVVDAACLPDVGNNRLKTIKDGVGGFLAWPKNQIVIEEDKVMCLSLVKALLL